MTWIEYALIYCKKKPECFNLVASLENFLKNRGVKEIVVIVADNIDSADRRSLLSTATEHRNTSLLIVLGGDGTFLSAVRWLADVPVPVVGINLGSLGFLTEISRQSCFEDLGKIVEGNYVLEERMRFDVKVVRGDEVVYEQTVLNDAVINKGALARIIDLEAYINGCFLTHYRADGLIVSTPTGSTAYNISAGGPIICPTARVAVITPICSFTLSDRPIVIPAPFTIEIFLTSREQEVYLTCDGQTGCYLSPEHVVRINVSEYPLRFIKPPALDFFEILRTKLKWGQPVEPVRQDLTGCK
ncbi:NAD(+)/NADH kinase [Thermodesulforhabdus norvegica]|uniref:NAD kinase n=1 Tax=Thermodesulforhabdus norvegica TaxID=39841 RepID=A0A1I4R0Z7_9BACT|nr:NAD(+)/NADH kinase [Thermodesulforhabdus norvegica]SFM45927.1 NAD+ kinase [Thermodesulforhabdus norvegica]